MTNYWIPIKVFIRHTNLEKAAFLLKKSLENDGYEIRMDIVHTEITNE